MANLEPRDIHPDLLMVRNGKGGKDRMIPLSPAMSLRLQNFISGKQPEDKVFGLKGPCITMKIKQFARKAGLTDFHAHSARHKFATDLLERGVNIKVVQELLGHQNLATTEIYLSITNQGLRDAINSLDDHSSDEAKDRVRVGDKTFRVVPWPTVEDVYIPKPIR